MVKKGRPVVKSKKMAAAARKGKTAKPKKKKK
jgi:hypothetical protein